MGIIEGSVDMIKIHCTKLSKKTNKSYRDGVQNNFLLSLPRFPVYSCFITFATG